MAPEYQILKDAWRTLLPPGIEIILGALNETSPDLTKRESESAGSVTSKRMLELKTGRRFAKQALSIFGIEGVELPVGLDRSPVWPAEATGSITHVGDAHGGHCVVAVGLTAHFHSIGIDIELVRALPSEVWSTFLTPRELSEIKALDGRIQQEEALSRWCVKESVIKATRLPFDPLAIETEKTIIGGQWHVFKRDAQSFGASDQIGWFVKSIQASGFVMAAMACTNESQ